MHVWQILIALAKSKCLHTNRNLIIKILKMLENQIVHYRSKNLVKDLNLKIIHHVHI